jgi:hypothetical protein
MLRRSLAPSLLVALALALPLSSGCGKTKQKLTEVEVPEAGVSMRYDLAPGQEYKGHVSMRNSAQTPVGDVVTMLEFDVALVVSANEDEGGKLVRATVDAIKLDLRLPEGIPAAAAGGLTPEAAASLNGMELRFNLSERGDVSNEPEPPESAPLEIKSIIGMVTSALTSGFVRVPEQPIKDGQSWDAKPEKTKVEVTSATNTGTLKGLARNEAGEDIAKLEFVAKIEAEREGQKFVVKQEVEASFSTTGGYVTAVKRKINNEIVGQGSLLSEIEAKWTKGGKQAVEAAAPATPAGEVQTITDPCDPDYVGAEECPADAAPTEAAPEG